ncbi:MAG: hypothetical protein ACLUT4_01910 [Lachnospiraceae bacterium]
MAIRKKQEPDEYQKALRKFHKKSNRHVVVFEADISEDEKRRIFSDADHLRQCGNELLGIMERNLEQLLRTKRYRALQKLYGKVADPIHALEKKEILSDEETQKLNHLKKIRGRLRVYVHITVEGKAISKRRKDSTPRHYYGKGNIGCDIGTQTIAYTSNTEVGLENLAERGNSIQHVERQEALILRAMERSRRAMNPNHYNENGTVKKGHKQWNFSKRYQKLRQRHQELCRIAAENRALAIREQVNHLRSLGDCFITEPPNAKKLQKRANPENPVDKNGRMKRKKRFGRSIKNRCPGYLQAKAKQLFESTGGMYVEVPILYRASQYDHTSDTYIPKKLSQRMYHLTDGTKVQRDWYSSYLLYCINKTYTQINKLKCRSNFATMYQKEKNMIEEIIRSRKKIMNSGIRTV